MISLSMTPCYRGVAKWLPQRMRPQRRSTSEDRLGVVSGKAWATTSPASRISDIDTVDTLPEFPCVSSSSTTSAGDTDAAEEHEIEQRMADAASHVLPWRLQDWEVVEQLQEAPRNQGCVVLAKSLQHGGVFAAVKQMPNTWVAASHAEFARQHPESAERPWFDVGVVNYLHDRGFEHVCRPLGVFRDTFSTYVVSSYATQGDLFSWLPREPEQGDRESGILRPLMQQLFEAVRRLHDLGIAHNDLSLENVLVTQEDPLDAPSIKLVDFGMASLARRDRGFSGKRSYIAPEQHEEGACDRFLSDAFAAGVCLFTLATRSYPWDSTRPGACKRFQFITKHGLRAYIARKRIRSSSDVRLAQVLSFDLVDMLDALLAPQPQARACMGEQCFKDDIVSGVRRSALSMPWLSA
uniref:Protein kinase domain-containing protein n=1 Tax=Zooxanthella nutricula TaxID=1333877 RepID=A0A7S2QP21_9DINO